MYGCNKLYCEMLGSYFSEYYRQLAAERPQMLDFRCVRFPGLISAFTVPSGGTSDYGPEMLHAAAKGEAYAAFVRADTQIPFMAMPDAIEALLMLETAPREKLTQAVYNIASFNPSAVEVRDLVIKEFADAEIRFRIDRKRQAIVDSWPEHVDDSAAREDWGFAPALNLEKAFGDYLVPGIRKRYGG